MFTPFEKICHLLDSQSVSYELLDHEPVYTSAEAAAIRGITLHQGAKALLLNGDGTFLLAIVPGDARLETRKLKKLLHIKNLRFATPEEVEHIAGCKIGAVYPFGALMGIRMLVDQSLMENEKISFNPGVHDHSIILASQDYQRIIQPELVNIVE